MIREKQPQNGPMIIDLTGPDGNAFALMSNARSLAKQLNLDSNKIISEMTTGGYENLIETFDKYFGDFVILER
jgi:hypothetical protein